MDAKSRIKVVEAGFSIIRCDDSNGARIKTMDSARRDWHTLAKFETKAARDRWFKQLLTRDTVICD